MEPKYFELGIFEALTAISPGRELDEFIEHHVHARNRHNPNSTPTSDSSAYKAPDYRDQRAA